MSRCPGRSPCSATRRASVRRAATSCQFHRFQIASTCSPFRSGGHPSLALSDYGKVIGRCPLLARRAARLSDASSWRAPLPHTFPRTTSRNRPPRLRGGAAAVATRGRHRRTYVTLLGRPPSSTSEHSQPANEKPDATLVLNRGGTNDRTEATGSDVACLRGVQFALDFVRLMGVLDRRIAELPVRVRCWPETGRSRIVVSGRTAQRSSDCDVVGKNV
jgi:hypothetical protein